jgi:hypothetical protein
VGGCEEKGTRPITTCFVPLCSEPRHGHLRQEAEEKKGNLAALGTGKFKSRSFEAWHKAGGRHLFAVNPKEVPYEERPYMQRKDGDWEGSDLAGKGLQGKGQGGAASRIDVDDAYETRKREGKL